MGEREGKMRGGMGNEWGANKQAEREEGREVGVKDPAGSGRMSYERRRREGKEGGRDGGEKGGREGRKLLVWVRKRN